MQLFRLSTAQVKVHQIPHVILQIKVSFSSKFRSFLSVMRDNSSVLFRLKLYVLLPKVVHESANIPPSHCSHWNSPNSSCYFWNQQSICLQTLRHSSVSWDIMPLFFYALNKRIQSNCKFSDFQLLTWKLTKFFMSFFKPRVSFRLNFATPCSVMTHNSSEIL